MPRDTILHHGAVDGVTGSCHELQLGDGRSVLIDCGLFQGAKTSSEGAGAERLQIDFPLDPVLALIVTHVHLDHVGRIPYLLAAGFKGPILCREASAELLPLVLEDAIKIGITRNTALIERVLTLLRARIIGVPYGHWYTLAEGDPGLRVRLQPAGHIQGSAFVECDLRRSGEAIRILFSGDLVVLESTYGDRLHEDRRERRQRLLQSQATAFDARRHVTCALSQRLEEQAAGSKAGHMNPGYWKTKNRGNLSLRQERAF